MHYLIMINLKQEPYWLVVFIYVNHGVIIQKFKTMLYLTQCTYMYMLGGNGHLVLMIRWNFLIFRTVIYKHLDSWKSIVGNQRLIIRFVPAMERGTKSNQLWVSSKVKNQTLYNRQCHIFCGNLCSNTGQYQYTESYISLMQLHVLSAEPIVQNYIKTLPRCILSIHRGKAGYWVSRERRSVLLSNVGTGRHIHDWRRHDFLQHWACARLQSFPVWTSDLSVCFCDVCLDGIFLHYCLDVKWFASERFVGAGWK